jgi:hypothetical protein
MEYFVFRCSRICSPKEHICRFLRVLLAQEPATSADKDALVDRGKEYLLFDIKNMLGFRVWVFAPIY